MEINLILDIITTACTVIATILAIYAARKYLFKEVYYEEKADDEFEKLELKDKAPKESYKFPDSSRKIFPQIVIEKRIFKKKITYFVEDNGKKMVKVWYV